jgi:Tol biopolymer transport system component
MKLREALAGTLVAAVLVGSSLEAQSASAAKSSGLAASYWLVLASDRDGTNRAYSIRPDGSRLTPLLPKSRSHPPQAVSANGRVVAYNDGYVSRADGSGLRRIGKGGWSMALSRNGRSLAFTAPDGIWLVGTNGRGRRRVVSGRWTFEPDFSPDGKAIAYSSFVGDDEYVFVKPLRGKRRRLGLGKRPKWSPDGRWIAYAGSDGARVVRPNGTQRHRVAQGAVAFSWSPNGKELAFDAGYLGVVGAAGGQVRKIDTHGLEPSFPVWAPDGRRLFVTLTGQLWTVGRDGRGLRRLTGAGGNAALGWTRLAPIQPRAKPLPPTERVVDGRTVATRKPVSDLAADGARAAFVTASPIDCDHAAVWTPASKAIARFDFPHLCLPTSTGSGIYDLELAGSRAAWVHYGGGNTWEFRLKSATLTDREPVQLSFASGDAGTYWPYGVRGDGDVLVFNDAGRLVRIGGGRERCQESGGGPSVCTTIRRGVHAAPIEAVSGQLIAVRGAREVAVVDIRGALVRVFPLTVTVARLDGEHLVVARGGAMERYGVQSGTLLESRPIPSGYKLVDVDGGIAVLQRPTAIRLLRLGDGRSLTIERRGPMFGDLEPPGIYYSYAVGKTGRVVFLPRAELMRRLG